MQKDTKRGVHKKEKEVIRGHLIFLIQSPQRDRQDLYIKFLTH